MLLGPTRFTVPEQVSQRASRASAGTLVTTAAAAARTVEEMRYPCRTSPGRAARPQRPTPYMARTAGGSRHPARNGLVGSAKANPLGSLARLAQIIRFLRHE